MKKTLLLIMILSALLLGVALGLNALTLKNMQDEHVWLMETLLPGSKDIKKLAYSGEDEMIRSVHQSSEGFVIETATQGYADEIVMYIGVNNDGKVTGLVVSEAHETVGLGSGILYDEKFLAQFLNKTGSFEVGTPDADGTSSATSDTSSSEDAVYVDGISGATVSSKAVARCVNSAIAYVTGADIGSSATW